jgi:hypothetical protein
VWNLPRQGRKPGGLELTGSADYVAAMTETIHDNTDEQRFELKIQGQTAYVYYALAPGIITFMHTDVPLVMSGQGVASRLIKGALEQVRARGLKVKAECPFFAGYLAKHPEYNDLIA